jgi:hypothetical protein
MDQIAFCHSVSDKCPTDFLSKSIKVKFLKKIYWHHRSCPFHLRVRGEPCCWAIEVRGGGGEKECDGVEKRMGEFGWKKGVMKYLR